MSNQPAPRRTSAPAVWVALILVALLGLTSALGRPADLLTTGGGAGWLPPDGQRVRLAGPDGIHASEWALDFAPALVSSGPKQFGAWLGVTKVNWQSTPLARFSTVLETPTGQFKGRSDDLFSAGPGGVRAEVVSGFDGSSLVYVPGRLDLPDTMAAGRSWTSEGAVLVTDAAGNRSTAGYSAQYSAATPADKSLLARACVVVTMREQIGKNHPEVTEHTWCRHGGLIAFDTPAGHWQAAPGAPGQVTPDAPFDWATAERLSFTPRTINHPVSIDEPGNVLVSPVSAPGILPDGTAVYANSVSADVIALQTGTDPPPVLWWARPGVRNTAAATFGTTTVVASIDRELVAYGPSGEWLWQVRLTDLTIVPPARLGDQVVVATLDGSVTSYDLATGTQLWRQQLSAEIRVAPIAAPDRVLVVDQGGELACFDPTGAPQWSVDVGPVDRFAVTPGTHPVVVVPNSNGPRVTGLSLADGRELWRPRYPFNPQDVIALDGVTVLRYNDQTIGLDPATGRQLWAWRGQRTFAGTGGGDRLLLLAADRLVLLDGRGGPVTEWPVAIGDLGPTGNWLVAAQGRVLVHGPRGVVIGVAG